MKTVVFPNGKPTSRVGFGCSTLASFKSEANGLDLVGAALDAGVRHFDVAPSYAWGEAEALLGRALRGTQFGITVTTKVGISAPSEESIATSLRRLISPLKKYFPEIWAHFGKTIRKNLIVNGQFSLDAVEKSFFKSRDYLSPSHIDAILLHEIRAGHDSQQLWDMLSAWRSSGKVDLIGVGSSFIDTSTLCSQLPNLLSIGQVNFYEYFQQPVDKSVFWITHSAVREMQTHIMPKIAEFRRQGVADLVSRKFDVDLLDDAAVVEMVICGALGTNKEGILLLSTKNPLRFQQWASLTEDGKQIDKCERILRHLLTANVETDFSIDGMM